MFSTPILFLIFNRPDTTKLVFEQIARVKPSKLYIAADGPRCNKPGEESLCEETRAVVKEGIFWNCKVKYLFRDSNLGCKQAVREAIEWFFEDENAGIILEDDCFPDLSFFPYCEELLVKFKDDESVMTINGCNFEYNYTGASYFYSRYLNSWGWATWRRSAIKIKYDIPEWEQSSKVKFTRSRLKMHLLDLDIRWFEHWGRIFDAISAGEIDTWDYQWQFYLLKEKKFSILPSKNLVKNLGFREEATHTTLINHPAAALELEEISFPLKHNTDKKYNLQFEENYVKPIHYMYRRTPNLFYLKRAIVQLPILKKIIIFLKNQF